MNIYPTFGGNCHEAFESSAQDVPLNRVTMTMEERQSITADTALWLSRYFCMTSQLWLSLQQGWGASTEIEAGQKIAKRVTHGNRWLRRSRHTP